jgi:hypothetical protein
MSGGHVAVAVAVKVHVHDDDHDQVNEEVAVAVGGQCVGIPRCAQRGRLFAGH